MSVTAAPAWLTTYTRPQLDQIATQGYNANATTPANTDKGSGLGAFFYGNELITLFVQQQLVRAALIARLATSYGADVDSFCNAFNVFRNPAQEAVGYLAIATPSLPSAPVYLNVGIVATRADGVLYTVIADPDNLAFDVALNQYVIPAGQGAINVTVQCQSAGSIGNCPAGTIFTPYTSGWTSISSISAQTAIATGIDVEQDAPFKARFTQRMSTGLTGTLDACAAAILATQPGLTISVVDQTTETGAEQAAFFTAVVAQLGQSGPTPGALITLATQALEGSAAAGIPATRPAGISYDVIGPTILPVTAAATITVSSVLPTGSTPATVLAACQTAFSNYIASIGLDPYGNPTLAALGKMYAVLYSVPGVIQVDGLTLNGLASDVTAGFATLMTAGATSFTQAG